MKNLYAKQQVLRDAFILKRPGICPSCSPFADTSTGYSVSNNQNSKKWWLLPKMAALLLLLQVFAPSITLNAQAPTVDYNWLQLKPSATGSAGAVFDKNNNFYTMNWVRDATVFVGKITRKRSSGIVDTTWIDFAGTGTERPADLIINAEGTALYYKSTNIASDSSFIGRITNLAGTPINEPRWKFLLKHTAPFGAFNSGAGVNNYGQLVIDKNENLYLTISNKIYKINAAGATELSTPFSQDGLNNKYATDMVVDDNDNLYLLRKIGATETSRYLTKVNAVTGVADTTWALLIDNASVEFMLSAASVHMTMIGNALYYAFDSVVIAPSAANAYRGTYKKKIKKVDLTTGISTLVNSFTSNRNNFSYSYSVADKNGNLYLTASDTSLVKLSNTGQLTVPFLKFNKQINAVGTTNPQLLFDGSNSLYQYHYEDDPDPFAIPPLTFGGYAKIQLPLSISFNQTQPTCANSTNGGLRAIPSETCGIGFQYLWTPGGATTDTISNLAPGTYSVRVICGTDTVNQSITLTASTVVPAPAASNQSLCNGATVADLVATVAAGNTIVWYATATGGSPLANSTPLVNATKYYAAQVTPANCESSTRAVDSVTIQATVAAKADSSYCNGANIAVNFVGASGNTYTWTATQNGTGIAASGTGNTSFTGVNNTNAVVTDTVIVSSSFNTCTPQRDTFAISVLPTPKVDSIANVLVCPSSAVAAINFTTPITNGTVGYKWTNSNTAIGLAASGFGNIPSFTAAATAQSSTISVTPYMLKSATDTCFGTVRTFVINADLPPAPTTVGSIVAYTGTKTISQLDVTPLTGGTLNYFYEATGGRALAGSTIVVDDTTYYVTQTVAGCESNRKSIKVNRIAADSTVLCSPATVAGLTATPQTGNTAKWFDVPTGGTALANSTPITVAQDTLYVEEGGVKRDTLVRLPAATTFNTISAFTHAENDTMFIGTYKGDIYRANPDGSNAVIIKPGTQQINWLEYKKEGANRFLYYTIYAGNDLKKYNLATGTVTSVGSGFFGVRQIHIDDVNNRIFIADAENYKIKMLNTSTNAITVIDSFPGIFPTNSLRPFAVYYHAGLNKLYFNNFETGKIYSKDLSSLSNPKVEIATIQHTFSISLLPNGKLLIATGAGFIYTLNIDGTERTTLKSGLIGPVNPFYNSNNFLTYNTDLKVVREGNIQSNRVPVTIIVNPVPIVDSIANVVVCPGSTVAAINFTTPVTSVTVGYKWKNSNTAIGLAASGFGNIPSFTTATTDQSSFIQVTPYMLKSATDTCFGTIRTFTISAASPPPPTIIGLAVIYTGTKTISQLAITPLAGGTLNYFYEATGGTALPGSTIVVDDTTYYVSQTVAGCVGNSRKQIKVNRIANDSIVFCNPDSVANLTVTPTAGLIVRWYDVPSGGTALANSTTITAAQDTLYVEEGFLNRRGYVPLSNRVPVIVMVNPTPTVTATTDKVACNNSTVAAVNFSTTTTGGTVTYPWTNSKPSIGLAASGTGDIASFTAVNNGTAPDTATIIVTPTITMAGVSCVGARDTFLVIVNPTAVVNAVNNQVVCAGTTNDSVSFSSPFAGTTYSWTNSSPSIGLAASGSGPVPSFVAVNDSPIDVTATITVTPTTAEGCSGQPITYTITVNSLSVAPVSINNPKPIVCANDAFITLSVNGGTLGSGATWKWYADSLNTVSIGTGATLSNIPVAKTTTYFVRAEGTCNNTAAANVVVQRANLVSHVRQHWSDVLLFDNSSKNFVAWQWYKNGVAVNGATLQQYSESSALVGTYYVIATDKNGLQTISCPLTITAGSFIGLRISLYPNPVDIGSELKVSTSFTASELQGANILITDVYGKVIRQMTQVSPNTAIQAPTTIGMYIVTLTLSNGKKYSANLLTK